MIYKKVAIALGAGALLLGSFASTAFADDNHSSMNHVSSNSIENSANNSTHNNWGWKQTRLFTFLDGDEEVPGPGDPNAFGYARVQVQNDKLCVNMRVYGIEPASAAHVHEGPEGVAGPVVVTLPTPNAKGYANGCVDVANDELEEIKNNPSHYYINVHNAEYPNGAIRGQL